MQTNDEIKKQLLAKYEALLDEVLAQRKADHEITLDEIEALVGEAQVGVGEDMLSSLTQVEQLEQPRCPQCRGQMQYKGRRPKQIITLRGEVKIESTYYYCPVCKTGFSPSA
jgi:tRNA(Ile2) C34 agmatinyltransferase TiaS